MSPGIDIKASTASPEDSRWGQIVNLYHTKDNIPLQRRHMGTPRGEVIPASLRRSRFSSGLSGHPTLAVLRVGFGER